MLSPNLINQSCDIIKESNLVDKKLSPLTNCSNNSSRITPTIKSTSVQSNMSDYLMGEKRQTPSIISSSSQSFTPQQFPISGNLNGLTQVAISPISSQIDNELLGQLSINELIYRIKSLEAKNRKLLIENGCLIKDINSNLANIQYCKHQILQLKKDNSELRDLCCYLDDERNKARQVANEWAAFGNYLKKEINNYNRKLTQLESKQFELVKENYELKQLCLLLDRAIINSKTGDYKALDAKEFNKESDNMDENQLNNDKSENNRSTRDINKDPTDELTKRRSILNYKLLNYIKQLETTVDQFEDERSIFLNKLTNLNIASSEELENFKLNLENNSKDNLNESLIKNLKDLKNSLKVNLKELKDNRPSELLDKAMEILDLQRSFEQQNLNEDEEKVDRNDFTTNNYSNLLLSKKDLKKNKEFDNSILNSNLISEDQKLIINKIFKKLCNAAYKKIEDDE